MVGSSGPHDLREEYSKSFFQHKSMETLDPQGRASLDPMGRIDAVATYQIYKVWPHGFREEDFKVFPIISLWISLWKLLIPRAGHSLDPGASLAGFM